jgi:hypothetical protein
MNRQRQLSQKTIVPKETEKNWPPESPPWLRTTPPHNHLQWLWTELHLGCVCVCVCVWLYVCSVRRVCSPWHHFSYCYFCEYLVCNERQERPRGSPTRVRKRVYWKKTTSLIFPGKHKSCFHGDM